MCKCIASTGRVLVAAACFASLYGARSMAADCDDPESAVPSGPDCNANGRADDCDVAIGASTDCNLDGVPDECDQIPLFRLGFRAPERVEGEPGGTVRIPVTVELASCGIALTEPGIQGWLIYVGLTNARPADATTSRTAGAPFPEGQRRQGFEKTAIFESPSCGEVVSSVVVLSITEEPVVLDPKGSPHDVLRFTLVSTIPESGVRACTLEFKDFCGYPPSRSAPADGGGADHPVETLITYGGDSWLPEADSKTVELVAHRPDFRRGDSNTDGRVDISDAIRTFMYLFLGASEPQCRDTADSNDDGNVDLVDGIHILNDFFRPGTGIPDPGPFDCGVDPTADILGCLRYPSCEQVRE